MKKGLLVAVLLTLVSSLSFGGVQPRPGAKVRPAGPPEAEPSASSDFVVHRVSPGVYAIGPGDSIGQTLSDYATNRSACHNIINFGDGGLSIGRMTAETSDATDRGTHYSYSADGGASWTPLTWVEGTRQGWGNIDQFPMAGGTEVTAAHAGVQICVDAARGANVWSCTPNGVATDLWPRLAVTDPFNVHLVTADANPPTTIWYSRSTDAGVTFDILDQTIFTLPGFQATWDSYDIASQGSKVAIVNATEGFFNSLDTDVLLATSTDDGTTWTDQVIFDMPGPGELPSGEEKYVADGTTACVYDNDGNLHVVWCNYLAIGDATNNPVTFYQIDAPLMHWSEATGITQIFPTVHDTSIVRPTNAFGNLVTQPDIAVDADNNLYVIYQQQISEQDTAGVNLQHLYAAASSDGGLTWSETRDITPGTGFDASFGSMADLVDDNLHITYFSDPLGGNFIRGNHALISVAVMYLSVPADPIILDVASGPADIPADYRLSQNYPNPFNPTTRISYSIPEKAPVNIDVFDVLGRLVATLVNTEQDAGTYAVEFDGSGLSDGTYFYRLTAGAYTETRKMLLLK